MYYLDLFSGIGGFALGAYWAGWRFDEHYFSEIDAYCIELYSLRFPEAKNLKDITQLNTENLPQDAPWIVTGGFPCQDISIAGKGEGISGKRSGLWFEMWRIIRDLQPRWVIIENVGAITFRGLSTVLNSLAEIGYDCEWQDIRASDMGAPHKRERIWIVAYPHKQRLEGCIRREERRCFQVDNISAQHLWKSWSDNIPQPFIKRGDDGFSRRMDRLRALGNAIIPQISELLFRRIKCLEEQMQ